MTILEIILAKFGPPMNYPRLADLFGCTSTSAGSAMRQSLRRDRQLGELRKGAILRFGRRVYFCSDLVAGSIDHVTGPLAATSRCAPEVAK